MLENIPAPNLSLGWGGGGGREFTRCLGPMFFLGRNMEKEKFGERKKKTIIIKIDMT
jgi:hypothetical protein